MNATIRASFAPDKAYRKPLAAFDKERFFDYLNLEIALRSME
jgi:hypothetical protein